MIGIVERRRALARNAALAVGTLAVLMAGAAHLDGSRARILDKSPAERQELHEALRRFDLRLNNEEQRAVRSLDARLNALPEADREEYLAVLRRYHNWLQQLPERERDDILAQPPSSRLDRIRSIAARRPPESSVSSSQLDFIQIGGTAVFGLASLCKTWLSLSPADRIRIDQLPEGKRKEALVEKARELKIPRELRPKGYREAKWIELAEARIKELGAQSNGPKDWLGNLEAKFEQVGEDDPEDASRARRFTRRLAANLYVQEHGPEHPVDVSRLTAFYSAIPSWIQSTFAPFPADEARRRLSVVYRSVYPHPEEYSPSAPPSPAGNQSSSKSASKKAKAAASSPPPSPADPF